MKVDWRDKNKVSIVHSTGQIKCNACWAFAGADALSSALAIYGGYNIDSEQSNKNVSIQHFLDCTVGHDTCNEDGGDPELLLY